MSGPQHAAVSLVHDHWVFYHLLGANTAKNNVKLMATFWYSAAF